MDALYTTTADARRAEWSRLLRSSALVIFSLTWLIAAVLLVRRLSGAIGAPPDHMALWSVAVLMVLLSAGARWLWRLSIHEHDRPVERAVIDWGCLPAIVIAGWAVAVPGTSAAGLAGFAAIVVICEGWALRGYAARFRSLNRAPATPSAFPDLPRTSDEILEEIANEISGEDLPAGEIGEHLRIDQPQTPIPHFPTADVAQQLVRRTDAEGGEVVEGWVRAIFEPGQRTSSAHVAFCPALEGELSIDFAHADGPEARVKAAQLLPYGVRFDVKLVDEAEQHETVLVEFAARASDSDG